MKKTVVLLCGLTSLGGVETFVLRMAKWLHQNGHRIIIICSEGIRESIKQELLSYNAEIHYFYCRKKPRYRFPNKLPISFSAGEEVTVIAFYYFSFYIAEHLRYLWKDIAMNIFFYVPHTYGIIAEEGRYFYGYALNKIIFKPYYKGYVKKLINDNQVIFMDEASFFYGAKYHYQLKEKSYLLARLPMYIRPFKIAHNSPKDVFNILTISRLAFPHKAYILTLVEDFAEVFSERSNARLTIIGYGAGESRLREVIESQPSDVQKAITLIGQTDYEQLSEYIDQADIFIGTGTTVLDSCNRGIPGVAVCEYEPDTRDYCLGYLYQTPWNHGYKFSEMRKLGMDISDELLALQKPASAYIREVMDMTQEEYLDLCRKCHQAVDEYYNIEKIVPQILSFENNDTRPRLNLFKIHYTRILYCLWDFADFCVGLLKRILKKGIKE